MDRLTELFANKPTSYTGLGLAYVGDTRGNAVVSGEQGLEVIPRIRADEGGGQQMPFTVLSSGVVVPGYIGGLYIPTINGVYITNEPAPALSIPSSGTCHVVFNISATLVKAEGVYVESFTINAVTLSVQSSMPTQADLTNGSGNYKVLLASFTDGRKTAQYLRGSFWVAILDDASGTGVATLYALVAF